MELSPKPEITRTWPSNCLVTTLYLHRQVLLQRQAEDKAAGRQPSLLQKSSPVDEESQPQKKLQAFKGGLPQM